MTDLRKAAEMALEFVEWLCGDDHFVKPKNSALEAKEALRQALAQAEQEPVAWMDDNGFSQPLKESPYYIPLYAAPPKQSEGKPIAFLAEAHNEDGDSLGYVAHTNFVSNSFPVYTLPPAWQGLTNKQIYEHEWWDEETAYAVNKFLMEKNR